MQVAVVVDALVVLVPVFVPLVGVWLLGNEVDVAAVYEPVTSVE